MKNDETERWEHCYLLPIDYEVSSSGNIRKKIQSTGEYVEVEQHIYNGVYCINCTGRTLAVHRCVALVFVANPSNFKTVRFIDGNKLNPSADNLQWGPYDASIQFQASADVIYCPELNQSYATIQCAAFMTQVPAAVVSAAIKEGFKVKGLTFIQASSSDSRVFLKDLKRVSQSEIIEIYRKANNDCELAEVIGSL